MRIGIAAGLIALIAAAPAEARWREASSEHFLIYSEQPPERLRAFATQLEKFDKGIRKLSGLPPAQPGKANRLIIYVVSGSKLRQIFRQGGETAGSFGIAGFYNARAGHSLAFVSPGTGSEAWDLQAETILFHEYTHHIMWGNGTATYPMWYSEGFAEFAATTKFDKDGAGTFGNLANHRAYGLFASKPFTVTALLGTLPARMTSEQREAIYGRGWLLTHYLTFSDSRSGQLQRYLQAINRGQPSLDAAREIFGDLKQLDGELDRYLNGRGFKYLTLPASSLESGAIAMRELSDGEDAIVPVRMRSQRGVNRKLADALLPEARAVAALHPTDPAVQVALAEAEFDTGHFDEATAAADRALAADPAHLPSMLYRSMIALHRARTDEAQRARHVAEARSWAVKANRLDPEDPRPLALFFRAHIEGGVAPSQSAVDGLFHALDLAPYDTDLRMTLIDHLIRKRELDPARSLLAPLAFAPHGGPLTEFCQGLITLIDAKDEAGLIGKLKSGPAGGEGDAG